MRKGWRYLLIGIPILSVLLSISIAMLFKMDPAKANHVLQELTSNWVAHHPPHSIRYWNPLVYLIIAIPVFIGLGACLRWLGHDLDDKSQGANDET